MAKARHRKDDEVSLFPFMSILVCVIGILMLMITAIALGQIGKDNVSGEDMEEQARRVNEFSSLQKQIKADAALLADLQQQVDDVTAKKQQLDAAREELERLKRLRAEADERAASQDAMLARHQAEVDELRRDIQESEQEIEAVDESLKKLKAELADREKPPDAAQVIIQPSGSGANLVPTFVECAASSVVLFEGPEPVRVPRGKLSQSEDFAQVLALVRDGENATLIFLIRPDGIDTYNAARNIARSRYVRNGKLAIASQGKIDLSRYRSQ